MAAICKVRGCDKSTTRRFLICRSCFYSLPEATRSRLIEAMNYRDYTISADERELAIELAIAEVEDELSFWRRLEQPA